MSASATPLRGELCRHFEAGADSIGSDDEFNELALQVFAHNFATVPAYGAYCVARDRTPESVDHWTGIPAVPTAAFKELPLHDETAAIDRVFRTSGTTRGEERRGEHHVADLELYRASLRASFRWYVLPDAVRPRMASLMPSSTELPDSSLAFMITDIMTAMGTALSGTFADAHGLDHDGLNEAMSAAVQANTPVLLMGTSSAFVHWLDSMAEVGGGFDLPKGSRLMDTGGYKGRGREWAPPELRAAYAKWLGIPGWACVNEYGMTELLSQYYDVGLREQLAVDTPPDGTATASQDNGPVEPVRRPASPGRGTTGRKRGPGWLRSVAVDPETLRPLPPGQTGLLRHVDLANLYSVAAVQTEDLGWVRNRDVVVLGRAKGAPGRGCSIAMDMLLEEAP